MRIALCGSRENGYYEDVQVGVRSWLLENSDCRLVLRKGRDIIDPRNLIELSMDGFIFTQLEPHADLKEYPLHLPRVSYSNHDENQGCPMVINDDEACGRLAARTLMECGYSHFYVLEEADRISAIREKGFTDELEAAGRSCERIPVMLNGVWGYVVDPIELKWPKNSAVFSANCRRLWALMDFLKHQEGLPDSGNLGILAGDVPNTERRDEGLAYVQLKGKEIGALAAKTLREMILGERSRLSFKLKIAPTEIHFGNTLRRNMAQQVFAAVESYCTDHLAENVLVDDMARAVGMSRSYLEKLLRTNGCPSPWDIITEVRMRHAEKLLETTALSIEQICDQVGYQERGAFAKRFRDRRGISPSRFRKQKRQG